MTKMRFLALLTVVALLVVPVTALAQPLPPHAFTGTVTIDGAAAPDGASVEAIIDGATEVSTTTKGSSYALRIVQPEGAVYTGKKVKFRVRTLLAAEAATWTMGEMTTLNLTAVSADTLTTALAGVAAQLVRVWTLDVASQIWRMYDPTQPALSDLAQLVKGRGYWVKVSAPTSIVTGSGNTVDLVAGWNLMGW